MITLYKYLYESLLDDEEDLIDNADTSIDSAISKELNDLNKYGGSNAPIVLPGKIYGKEKEDDIKVSDGKLMTLNNMICRINLPDAARYKNVFDTVISAGVDLVSRDQQLKDNFIKTFISSSFSTAANDIELSNVDIQIENWPTILSKYGLKDAIKYATNRNYTTPVNFVGYSCKLTNCNIKMGGVGGSVVEFRQLKEFPILKNCKFGCSQINLMGWQDFFKSKEVLSSLDKVIAKGEYQYGDAEDNLFKKVNGIKDIVAIIRNPKKYAFYASRGPHGKPRKKLDNFINENANLSDAFPWVADFKLLNTINICSNKVKIKFMKKTSSFSEDRVSTKDGWIMSVEYVKYSIN